MDVDGDVKASMTARIDGNSMKEQRLVSCCADAILKTNAWEATLSASHAFV
ncbi:MAG: hypothetical protein M3X11_21880 [Acidobacteriota bacterium]|nr:hypothetical protein [Acidobacteriota bacterium]